MNYNWNWHIYWELSPDGQGTYFHSLLVGLGWTLATALAAWVIALVLGSALGVMRTSYKRALYGHAVRHADLLLCISEFTRSALCRFQTLFPPDHDGTSHCN